MSVNKNIHVQSLFHFKETYIHVCYNSCINTIYNGWLLSDAI